MKKTARNWTKKKPKQEQPSEIIFLVGEAPEGGYVARALSDSIYTEADTLHRLHAQVRDAVRCHFDAGKAPKMIRLHFVHEEILAV